MKSDILYIGILLLVMIILFFTDVKLSESLGYVKRKTIHHTKRTIHFVRKTMTKRQKPENKKDGTSIDNTKGIWGSGPEMVNYGEEFDD